jgi:glycosyltransferase involved in cell wall biosynthesis
MKIFYPYPEEFTFNRAREIQTIHTCHALARQGSEVTLGTAKGSGLNREALLEYFRLEDHPLLKVVFFPRYLHLSRQFVVSFQSIFLDRLKDYVLRARSQGQIDLIYTRHLKVAEFCLRQQFGVPIVFESHEVFSLGQVDSPEKFRRLYDQEKMVYGNVQGLVTISDHLKSYLESHFQINGPILKAPDGVDLELFGKLASNHVDHQMIIYTGSLFGWKGVDTLIKAMRYLPHQQLHIFGGGPNEISEKRQLAEKWKVSARCHFHGYVSRTDLVEHLARAYIGVLPNHREEISERFTSPLKLFEYMAAGKVIVASDLPSIREILNEDKAYLCPPGSPRSLAETIQSVYRNPQTATSKVSIARALAKKYSWDCRAQLIGEFLQTKMRDINIRNSWAA